MRIALPSPWNSLPHGEFAADISMHYLQLSLRRDVGECWLAYRHRVASDTHTATSAPEHSLRFLLNANAPPLAVEPLLADRAVVSRPLVATELPPRHSATLLISTPLWVRLRCGEQTLVELPTTRLSDTWFGPNTRSGELCYAAQTRARQRVEDNAAESPFRALTPVTIINNGEDNLQLERINVPVPHLTLYGDGANFWTSAITMTREQHLLNARIQINDGAPEQARGAATIAEPRRPVRGGVLERAVELLFA